MIEGISDSAMLDQYVAIQNYQLSKIAVLCEKYWELFIEVRMHRLSNL